MMCDYGGLGLSRDWVGGLLLLWAVVDEPLAEVTSWDTACVHLAKDAITHLCNQVVAEIAQRVWKEPSD
eukprot:CAMPEP_0174706834 /NCGR_PEP_ID=MMETSP1094-20130205/9535_1 /TAXON_ID=156173 /ORGANISM="Chrysochromulina brevifilum, Strain UTEX LB 985" /LENGTH=68 /DNA_ID=CAMNT_0015905145 /DNA_START=135 /DNA_END=341 /DNA_ORIENTATION=+